MGGGEGGLAGSIGQCLFRIPPRPPTTRVWSLTTHTHIPIVYWRCICHIQQNAGIRAQFVRILRTVHELNQSPRINRPGYADGILYSRCFTGQRKERPLLDPRVNYGGVSMLMQPCLCSKCISAVASKGRTVEEHDVDM